MTSIGNKVFFYAKFCQGGKIKTEYFVTIFFFSGGGESPKFEKKY
jgi:hypothetical protein